MNTNRIKFMNVNIDSLTAQEAVNVIDTFVQERTPRYVVTPNSDIVVKMQKDNELLDSCNNADLILTDGEIVVKLASFLGKTIKERVPMTDFVWDVLNLAEDKGYKVCLFGGREDVLKKGQIRNAVQDIYAPFSVQEINEKIVEMLRPEGMTTPVELVYQSVEGLHHAIPNHKGDWYFTGNYPTPGGMRLCNQAFINYVENTYQYEQKF